MAKLETVKVLDKSNGAVSRIRYNGVEYVRVAKFELVAPVESRVDLD
jgi:hypothetical protein